ncbi:MAG: hypothetical protein CMC08_00255 [Flavobacteriaceae bacterium]|nr:hypothetical protein [Flavobacteriaceae bacterium]
MSYAELLRKFAERPVTPVTPCKEAKVTENREENQTGNLSYLSYPKEPREAERNRKPRRLEAPLHEIAQTLGACPNILRSLLSEDDMEDIAEGLISRSHLIAYFRLMRSEGIPLTEDYPSFKRSPENRSGHVQRMQVWKPAHEDLIDHLMACADCHAPLKRYCEQGASLRQAYIDLCTAPLENRTTVNE